MDIINRFITEDEGADATEYALMLALVALMVIAGATALGGKLGTLFNNISNSVGNVTVP